VSDLFLTARKKLQERASRKTKPREQPDQEAKKRGETSMRTRNGNRAYLGRNGAIREKISRVKEKQSRRDSDNIARNNCRGTKKKEIIPGKQKGWKRRKFRDVRCDVT